MQRQAPEPQLRSSVGHNIERRASRTGLRKSRRNSRRFSGKREQKRDELLEAAVSVTVEEGYSKASLRKVAQRARCTTGALIYYFGSKEELGLAVAHNLFDRFEELVRTSQVQVDIEALIEDWLDWAITGETEIWFAIFQLLAHARQKPEFAEIVKRRYTGLRETLITKLKKGQASDTVRSDIDAALLADQISALADGWMMRLSFDRDRFSGQLGCELKNALICLISPTRPSE